MKQLSHEVSNRRFVNKGFEFDEHIEYAIDVMLKLLS